MSARIAIVGAGITGLTAAHSLLSKGMQVTVLEARPSVGGLAATQDFGDFHWDRFYHCILTSDTSLLRLIDDLGLRDKLRWRKTEVGFYSKGALHTMTSPMDLLRYPCLPLWAKIRFGLGVLYASRLRDGERLESVPLKNWVLQVFGETVYREMWEPLLRCKLGEMRSEASAAFLWATIRRLSSTRDKNVGAKEQLGYVEGGYRVVFDRLAEAIAEMDGQIETGVSVSRVQRRGEGIEILADGKPRQFDACLMTVPSPAIRANVPSLSQDYQARLQMPKYLGMVCVVLVMRRQLSPYYLTNVTEEAPFTGVVEMTNLIDAHQETNGRTLVYLPKYTSPSDPLFAMSDEEVWDRFAPALYRIHPDLQPSDILSTRVFRERFVQPVPTLNYSAQAPTTNTGIPHLFVANTSQIVNDTLNNNAMTAIARKAAELVAEDVRMVQTNAQAVLNSTLLDATANMVL